MMRGLRQAMLDRCAGDAAHGHCWCRLASTCRFNRCTNCDMPVDKNGKALMSDYIDAEEFPCEYCEGPMPKLFK